MPFPVCAAEIKLFICLTLKNILAAKMILQTEHVLVVEAGAQKFASESGVPTLSPGQLIVTSDSKTSLHEEGNNGKG